MMLQMTDTSLSDNFTPRDFQVELYESAKLRNTIACLKPEAGKTFIAVLLIREKGIEVCRSVGSTRERCCSVYLTPTVSMALQQSAYLRHHTPLKVGIFHAKKGVRHWDRDKWKQELNKSQVLVMTYSVFLEALQQDHLSMNQINLLILDECHNAVRNPSLKGVLESYCCLKDGHLPRILGLTASIVNNKCRPAKLAKLIVNLESSLQSIIQTSNSILSSLQHSIQPRELICATSSNAEATELELQITERIQRTYSFMRDHRYDPTEYYGEQDYLKEIPDPCTEPLSVLEELIQIVQAFGPWGADRAALVYLIHLEKLKTRAVYERHYLLLCLVYTLLLEIRSLCEEVFQKFNDYERIEKFSRPKVLRLLEVLRLYRPPLYVKKSVQFTPTTVLEQENKMPTLTEDVQTNAMEEPSKNDPLPEVVVTEETIEPESDRPNENQVTSEELVDAPPALPPQPSAHPPHFSRRRRPDFAARHQRNRDDIHQLCGIIFAERRTTAKLLYHLLKDASRCDPQLAYLSPLYTVGRTDGMSVKEAESEDRKQEDVMKRFRSRDCNILVATSVMEDGIDVPACHLVVRYDLPTTYRAYVHSKARARARKAHYVLLVEEEKLSGFLGDLSQFHAIEQILLHKSGYGQPNKKLIWQQFQLRAEEVLSKLHPPYRPSESAKTTANLSNAIAVVNRYCAKLPSDCFTRLTPIWEMRTVQAKQLDPSLQDYWNLSAVDEDTSFYICSLQLPINSPLRRTIVGLPMPDPVLAKRSVALETCRWLHRQKELDDSLYPVGKENLRLEEEEDYNADLEEENVPDTAARPGTTKRRQYYYKQVADPLTDCVPKASQECHLYAITMVLTEPIPEEQNTRGRKIYKPETSNQSLGILSRKPLSQICPFPIFTRSGEVEIDVVRVGENELDQTVVVDDEQLERIANFQRYIFHSVLSLEKDPMVFDVQNADCSYLIVPLRRIGPSFSLDFAFIDLISSVRDAKPQLIPDSERTGYVFDPRRFADAVVMRWYRDQEHPQCFYVAEIFYDLNPTSKFPDNNYSTFERYYREKYGIQIQNLKQPLLDVDHTSARLNFLTPRYVNRKGVMLPTSSEHTKKTQRESLQQKQILVPELCSIHPFSASLWRQAVCLPCILYRLNGLLLAEKLRCQVATEISLGKVVLNADFRWPALRFGWKRKIAAGNTGLPALPTSMAQEVDTTSDSLPTEEVAKDTKSTSKPLRPPNKTLKSNPSGAAMMDIGVWNPNAVQDNDETPSNGDEDYDYNDLQAVSLLTNENVADFDWTKPVPGDSTSGSGSAPSFNMTTNWADDSPIPQNSVPCNYSDYGGSYNSDCQSMDDDDDDYSDGNGMMVDDDVEDEERCKVKEFGPKLVFKGDTAEAVEDPIGSNKLKKMKSPEEEELEDGEVEDDEEPYEKIEDLLSLDWNCWEQENPESDRDLEVRCEQLLTLHRDVLVQESLVTADQALPILPPFVNRANPVADEISRNVEESPDEKEPKRPIKGAHRLASESPHLIELTKLLLGNHSANCPEDSIFLKEEPIIHPEEKATVAVIDSEETFDFGFSFDEQPGLEDHPGPSPSVILQAFTMSSANDGINLERLETIGDSFLKYSITTYLYCKYGSIHEGKLSYLRSRQVSNLHLYQLGRRKNLGGAMVATKFNPHDNWLPPGYVIPDALEEALITSGIPLNYWNVVDLQGMEQMSSEEVKALVKEKTEQILQRFGGQIPSADELGAGCLTNADFCLEASSSAAQDLPRFVPYNLLTQHSIPDKSVADCVEALIGAYLTACGPRGALLFMSWLGLKVLPPAEGGGYGYWVPPISPAVVDRAVLAGAESEAQLERMLAGFESFEEKIGYKFRDRFYLLQAFSHASYYPNRLTDCYQRLEFLGDAVLDYLITRYLYEDPRQHPPGALTDLRSALVNNTTFAVLAVRFEFHRYFKHFSHTLNQVMDKFIKAQEENGHCINEEYYLIEEGESEEAEDVEVPKALGDVFESVAGAIYLDSGMSLNAVWKVYYGMMKNEIDEFSKNVPKSPIRELLELETDRVKFGKAERLPDGRVRVTVDVIGKGTFKGIGRNYRIAKCTAAKFALRTLEKRKMLSKRGEQ